MIQLILLAVNFPALGVSTAIQKAQQVLMKVNYNGDVAEKSLPTCTNGGKINLLSYHYNHCATSIPCDSSLSPEAELRIHEMCSLKKTCDNLKFPQADAQHINNETTEISVTYKCLDQFSTFVDICSNTSKTDDKIVHLIYRNNINNSATYENCSCDITGVRGNFSVAVADLRLKSATNRTCTRSKLYANDRTFTCNDTRKDYGSVFIKAVKRKYSQYLVKFDTGHSTVEPEMMYLKIEPGVKVKLLCRNKPRKTASFEPSAFAFDKTSSIDEDSTSSMTATIAGVCGISVALTLVSVAVFMKYKSRNWKYTKWISNLERLVERYIQHPREASPAQCIDDDYVELKQKSRTPESVKCNGAGFVEPPDLYYDPVNDQKQVLSTVHALQATKDSNVYSYAEHQPVKRMKAATQCSASNPDDRNGDNAISKHVYVKLLPVQETAAGECCDSVQSDAGIEMKGQSNNNQSDASHLKKIGFFNGTEVNEKQSSYSFAKEPYQTRTNPLFDSQNPEEPMTHSSQNQYDTTSATKMKAIPCNNYDHAKKRDNSETSCASDDEHYDRVDGDRIPVQINPNYDKLSK